jgi:hypothetical protein
MTNLNLLFGASCGGIEKALYDYEDPNIADRDGKTALHWCITPQITKLLINSGADINLKDKNGNTPLDLTYGDEKAMVLISYGAEYIPQKWMRYSHLKKKCRLCNSIIISKNCKLCYYMYKGIYNNYRDMKH